jgi:SAM-dependent methyltransferase
MPSNLLSKFYEGFHKDRRKAGTVSSRERIDFIVQEVGKEKNVVELGCRFGGLLKHFVEGNKVTGADIDRTALKQCADMYGITTYLADLNDRLPFRDAEFDVVVLSEVLEHLPYPTITLSEAARICKPQGKLVGSVPNAYRLKNRLRFLIGGPVELDPTHLHHYSAELLERTLSKHFADVYIRLVSGRLVFLSERFFANYILFSARRPFSREESLPKSSIATTAC